MPNIKSAKKRVQVSERNRLRNVAVRSEIKTAIKNVYEAIKNSLPAEEITQKVNRAYKLIDKAVAKNVLHKNTAGRRKSNIMKHVNAGSVPQ